MDCKIVELVKLLQHAGKINIYILLYYLTFFFEYRDEGCKSGYYLDENLKCSSAKNCKNTLESDGITCLGN